MIGNLKGNNNTGARCYHLKSIRNILMVLSMFFSFISIYLGFKNSDKILAGLGLFALSFWTLWFDPVTRDISEKTESTPKTFEEVFVDLSTTALLTLIILYTFFFSQSGKAFLSGIIILVLLTVIISRFYEGIVQHLKELPKEKKHMLSILPALIGGAIFLAFRNLGGMAVLLGLLASTLLLLEFNCSEPNNVVVSDIVEVTSNSHRWERMSRRQ